MLRLESRPPNIEGKGAVTIRDLVRNSLRMRPDRIVVGEVRDAAALDMLQAMNTGHDGSICTVHSNGPRDTCSRLETMVLMAGMDLPIRAIREQVASRGRPDRAPGAPQGRHPPHHPRHRGRAAWRATSSRCRTSSCSTTPPASTPRGAPSARLKATGLRPEVPREDAAQQRPRRPADLRHRHGLPMTATFRRAGSVVLGLFLGLLSFALFASAPASAADGAVIDHAQPTTGAVRLLVSVPGTDAVDYSGVTASIAGKEVTSHAEAASTSSDVQRTSILAIDTSKSMTGTRITEAKKAALTYLATVPKNVQVGVVSFDDSVTTLVAPTLDRAAATKAIQGLTLKLHTALYEGVLGAIKAAGPGGADAGQRKILVLSDGMDTTGADVKGVLDAIKKSGVGVDVVSLQQGATANKPLEAMASAGKGTVFTTADPAALSTAFAREATALAHQIVVTAQVPAGFESTSADVGVSVPSGSNTFTASAYVTVRSAADIAADKASAAAPQPVRAGPLALSTNVVLGGVGCDRSGPHGCRRGAGGRRQQAGDEPHPVRADPGVRRDGGARSGRTPPRRRTAPRRCAGQARQAAEKALANNKNLEARIAHRSSPRASTCVRPSGCSSVPVPVVGRRPRRDPPRHRQHRARPARRRDRPGRPADVPQGQAQPSGSRRSRTGLADTLQLMSGSLSAGPVPGAVDRHDRPRGRRADRQRVPARRRRDPARRHPRGLDGGRGRADGEPRLRLGRDGDPDPARGRRQPGRAAARPWPPRCASASTCAATCAPCRPRDASPATSSAACPRLPRLPRRSPSPTTSSRCTPLPSAGSSSTVMGVLLGVGVFWMSKVAKVDV